MLYYFPHQMCTPIRSNSGRDPPSERNGGWKAPRRDSQPGRWTEIERERQGSEEEHKKEMEAGAGGTVKDAGGRRGVGMGWAVGHSPQLLFLVLLGRISSSNSSFSLSHVASSSVSICWLICHPLKRIHWSLAHLTWAKVLPASGRHRQPATAGDERTFQLSVPAVEKKE